MSSSAGQLTLLAALAGRGLAEEGAEDAEAAGEGEGEGSDGPVDAASILADLDANKDGLLEFEEFMKGDTEASDEEKDQLKKAIAQADADGDGKLNKEEIPALLKDFDEPPEPEKEDLETVAFPRARTRACVRSSAWLGAPSFWSASAPLRAALLRSLRFMRLAIGASG
eukprot:CAMPEP_0175659786 /NCGR_PEP_ID=MMETSP0097-20121207/14111_1 /TAXON_ID=311494 /ORGANISM="Alexandrium monilatum, Strain CCMP3105" /LENGTH=168 /DNA_ID=CAMNT_0016965915 /DNA_START=146 /DNA_END=649 /DNA_ORIENTATION=-